MKMITKSVLLSVSTMTILSLTGCGGEEPKPVDQVEADFRCHKEGVLAPEWTCSPMFENSYAEVGSAPMSAAGENFSRREALANARSNLAQQIETQVKDKVETFARGTGIGSGESVDKVTTQVSKQVAKVTLSGSKQVKYWQNPKTSSIYVLVAISESAVNEKAKEAVKTSYKNDDALWQQFQAKNALENLEKEFPSN
jgi:hypothetical protein